MIMGCYGIGVSRVVAAAIEQSHDERGIIWPKELAPFQVALCPMHWINRIVRWMLWKKFTGSYWRPALRCCWTIEKSGPSFMFSDMELIGIPHRIVIGDRGLDNGTVEYQGRLDKESRELAFADIVDFIKSRLV